MKATAFFCGPVNLSCTLSPIARFSFFSESKRSCSFLIETILFEATAAAAALLRLSRLIGVNHEDCAQVILTWISKQRYISPSPNPSGHIVAWHSRIEREWAQAHLQFPLQCNLSDYRCRCLHGTDYTGTHVLNKYLRLDSSSNSCAEAKSPTAMEQQAEKVICST